MWRPLGPEHRTRSNRIHPTRSVGRGRPTTLSHGPGEATHTIDSIVGVVGGFYKIGRGYVSFSRELKPFGRGPPAPHPRGPKTTASIHTHRHHPNRRDAPLLNGGGHVLGGRAGGGAEAHGWRVRRGRFAVGNNGWCGCERHNGVGRGRYTIKDRLRERASTGRGAPIHTGRRRRAEGKRPRQRIYCGRGAAR